MYVSNPLEPRDGGPVGDYIYSGFFGRESETVGDVGRAGRAVRADENKYTAALRTRGLSET